MLIAIVVVICGVALWITICFDGRRLAEGGPALRILDYRQVSAILLSILVGVVGVDSLGSRLRKLLR